MSDLFIYLGSSSSAQTEQDTRASNAVLLSVPDLPQATKAVDRTKVWKTLHLVVLSSEVASVFVNPMSLASFQLNDDAQVTVSILNDKEISSGDGSYGSSFIHTAFLLAGLQGTSESRNDNGTRIISALKKNQTSQPSSAKAIALPKRTPPLSSSTVTISLDDDDDMINEDDLLQDEGELAPNMNGSVIKAGTDENDCGGRTACDDCTCGRAELEQLGLTQNNNAPMKTSACGKCGLGDAFRCASCPFLGKPAFKPGQEHLVLDLQDDF